MTTSPQIDATAERPWTETWAAMRRVERELDDLEQRLARLAAALHGLLAPSPGPADRPPVEAVEVVEEAA